MQVIGVTKRTSNYVMYLDSSNKVMHVHILTKSIFKAFSRFNPIKINDPVRMFTVRDHRFPDDVKRCTYRACF